MTVNPFAPIPEASYATPKQVAFIQTLTDERDLSGLTPTYRDRILVIAASIYFQAEDPMVIIGGPDKPLTISGASALIDTLLPLPRRADAGVELGVPSNHTGADICPEVIQGRYALDAVQGGHTVFYLVDRPDTGQYAGNVYVSVQISDGEQRVPRNQVVSVLSRIREAGVRESAIRYGREIGRCSLCGRTLTNEGSRERGIGPKCAETAGW